jgi:hypothetical protein
MNNGNNNNTLTKHRDEDQSRKTGDKLVTHVDCYW